MPQFPNNLIGIGNICDKGCTVTFTATEVIVQDKNGIQIWQGLRETNGARMCMWRFDIRPQAAHTVTPYNLPQLIPPDDQEKDEQEPRYQLPQQPIRPINMTPPVALSTRAQVRRSTYHCKAYDLPSTARLIKYLHATAGSPAKSTWMKAVQAGNYKSWSGITRNNVA